MVEKKRLTAIKTKIRNIASGKFVTQEGLEPNYVIAMDGTRISRARVLATVVDKFISDDKKFSSITIDDGSDTIRVKAFNSLILDSLQLGDTVDVIGRLKNYEDETYISPENIFFINDPNFEILRELELIDIEKKWENKKSVVLNYNKQVSDLSELKELMKEFSVKPEEVESILQSSESEDEPGNDDKKAKILEIIEKTDSSDGCDYSLLIAHSGLPEDEVDSIVEELLENGVCFEPRPGKIKKL